MDTSTPLAPTAELSLRQSAKWRTYAPDVLPMFVVLAADRRSASRLTSTAQACPAR
jgi:hypothetical protein